ncbi:MAG: DUF3052 family protein [Candidatus Dormibacteria bacterium]
MNGAEVAPLTRKLGLRAGDTIALVGAPSGWTIPALPERVRVRRVIRGPLDLIVVFVREPGELVRRLTALRAALRPAGSLWVAWPRRAGGHQSAVTETELRRLLLPTGLVDTKVAALDPDWSGLRFVVRRALRPPSG